MGNKRIYFLSILYIAAYAIIVKFVYPELEVAALVTVIALLGFVSALITNYLLSKRNDNKGNYDE
tara:strand:+ start:179 stop:373 length:195 start_codon:yes stop_codon:yes gene_type:complete